MNVEDLLSRIDLERHPTARSIAENAAWMEERLKESREAIRDAPIVMPYDNGGGQTGIRRNPMYDAYEALMSSFQKACSQLESMVDDDVSNADAENVESTPLQIIIDKNRKAV